MQDCLPHVALRYVDLSSLITCDIQGDILKVWISVSVSVLTNYLLTSLARSVYMEKISDLCLARSPVSLLASSLSKERAI